MCSTMCGVERNSMHPMFITCNKRTVALKWAKENDTVKLGFKELFGHRKKVP